MQATRMLTAADFARLVVMPDADLRLRADLDAFYTEHRRCGELDGGVEGPTVWFDCERGARIARRADAREALDVKG